MEWTRLPEEVDEKKLCLPVSDDDWVKIASIFVGFLTIHAVSCAVPATMSGLTNAFFVIVGKAEPHGDDVIFRILSKPLRRVIQNVRALTRVGLDAAVVQSLFRDRRAHERSVQERRSSENKLRGMRSFSARCSQR